MARLRNSSWDRGRPRSQENVIPSNQFRPRGAAEGRIYWKRDSYLLFIADRLGCGHQGTVAMGPGGVFTVEDDGLIEPIAIDWCPLRKYIARHCCNSLSQLRAKIQQM